MTSPYEQASERASVRPYRLWGRGRVVSRYIVAQDAIFSLLAGFKKRKLISIVMSTNDSRVDITFLRQGLTEAEREGELQRARINRQRTSQGIRERERARGPFLESSGNFSGP